MTPDTILAYGTLVLAAFTGAGIVVAIRVYRRQCNVQVFLEYTKRYDEIMNTFPVDGRKARLNSFGEAPAQSEDLSLAVLRYLNLCSEEFHLWKKKYLSKTVWKNMGGRAKANTRKLACSARVDETS